MSTINPVGGPVSVPPPSARVVSGPGASTPARASDRLELSGASHLLHAAKANDIRTDKVNEVRAQIAAGTYETDAKLDAAADKLLDDLLGE